MLALMNIVAAIQAGDKWVFEETFFKYHNKLFFYIAKKTNSTNIAEEVTQITFIKLWQYKHQLNPDLDISIQLFRIAKTTLIDVIRKEQTVERTNTYLKTLYTNQYENNTEQQIHTKELQLHLQKAMNSLPTVRRKVFEMSRIQGLSYKEIAAELSISIKTVEHHISLALKQLRHIISLYIIYNHIQ